MTMHAKVSGVWKNIPEAFTNVNGTWKRVLAGYVNVSGVWKEFFSAGTVTVSGHTIVNSGGIGNNTAAVTFLSSGTVTAIPDGPIDTGTDWVRPVEAAVSGYQIRFTNLIGDAPIVTDNTAEGEWFDLSSGNFALSLTSTIGTLSCTFTIEIRRGTGPVLDSGTYSLQSTLI